MRKIQLILPGGEDIIEFQLEENFITVETLLSYCANASGIVYFNEPERTPQGLKVEDGRINLNPSVDKYLLREKAPMAQSLSPISTVEAEKRKKMKDMKAMIEERYGEKIGNKRHGSSNKNNDLDSKKIKLPNVKSSAPSKPAIAEDKIIEIGFGWRHRNNPSVRFIQVRKPEGGIKKIQFHSNEKYYVDDLIEAGKTAFESNIEKRCTEESTFELSLSDEKPITVFQLPSGQECDLWDAQSAGIIKRSQNFYILSTSIPLESTSPEKRSIGSSDSEDELNSLKTPIYKHLQKKYSIIHDDSLSKLESTTVNKIDKQQDQNQSCTLSKNIVPEHRNLIISRGCQSDLGKTMSMFVKNNNDEIFIIRNKKFKIKILYSRYIVLDGPNSNCSLTEGRDKDSIFWALQDDPYIIEKPVKEFFEPLFYTNTLISRIELNGQRYYEVLWNSTDLEIVKHFPIIPPNDNSFDHTILLNVHEFCGFCGDEFGVGFLVTCTEQCYPVYTWYKNDIEYATGGGMFWISKIPENEDSKWHCIVTCNQTSNLSSILTLKSNQSDLTSLIVPKISSDQYTVEEKIGEGGQGTVYKGSYLKDTVAIKRFIVPTKRVPVTIQNEIDILEQIRDEHFIFIKAICQQEKIIDLIMEYFPNVTLHYLIYDRHSHEQYKFLTRRLSFAQQLCKAIFYLHNRQPCKIIHQDIKPQNILINEQGQIKLCDFGLSTTITTVKNFGKTMNNIGVGGTLMYVAPELYIANTLKAKSSKCNIWSLGITLLEMYNCEHPYDIDDQEVLIQQMRTNSIKLIIKDTVPKVLNPILQKCFSYVPEERPNIEDVLDTLNSMENT